jgi:hypothetical protein
MEIKEFKEDLFDAVWRHSKKLFLPSVFMTIVSLILFLIVILPAVLVLFPKGFMFQMASTFGPNNMGDPQEIAQDLIGLLQGMVGIMVVFYLIILISMILIGSWVIRVSYTISKRNLEGESNWFSVIPKSFDSVLKKSMQASTMIMGIYLAVVLVVYSICGLLLSAGISFGLVFFMYFLFIIIAYAALSRFVLVLPGIVIGKLGLRDSVRFSLSNMTLGRGFKLVGVIFLATLAAVIIFVIVILLANLIWGPGTLNSLLTLLLMLFMNSFFFAFAIAGSAGLFYRYGNFEGSDENTSPEDHLITEL